MQSRVGKIVPSEEDSSKAGGVVVSEQMIPADFIVMGVGVSPATEFLKQSDIILQHDGSIKVDEHLRVEGFQDIFAIGICFTRGFTTVLNRLVGDIATYTEQKSGQKIRVEHWAI